MPNTNPIAKSGHTVVHDVTNTFGGGGRYTFTFAGRELTLVGGEDTDSIHEFTSAPVTKADLAEAMRALWARATCEEVEAVEPAVAAMVAL